MGKEDLSSYNLSIIEDWLLGKIIYNTYSELYINEVFSEKYYLTFRILLELGEWFSDALVKPKEAIKILFTNENVQKLLQFNRYQEILYFHAENFEELLKILFINSLTVQAENKLTTKQINNGTLLIKKLVKAAKSSGYRVAKLIELL